MAEIPSKEKMASQSDPSPPQEKNPEAEFGDGLVDKLKKGLKKAYEAGSKVVDELTQTAQEYTEKYKAESEIKKLKGENDQLTTQLGHSVLKRQLAQGNVTDSFFKKKEMIDQFNQIEKIDKLIIKAGRQLDSAKK